MKINFEIEKMIFFVTNTTMKINFEIEKMILLLTLQGKF